MQEFSQGNIQKRIKLGEISMEQGEIQGLNIRAAMAAHEAWKAKLELTLRSKTAEGCDPDIIGADDQCVLGKWLYGDGKKLSDFTEYKQLITIHARFHQCAREIVINHRSGRLAEAISGLRHDLSKLSDEVQATLLRISRRMYRR